MRSLQVFVSSVLRKSSPIIVKRHNLLRRHHSTLIFARNAHFILVNIVTKMNDIVDTILSSNISVRVEVAKRVVRTREDTQANRRDIVVFGRCSPSSSNGARSICATDCELVIIACERAQVTGFDLSDISVLSCLLYRNTHFDCVVDIRSRISSTTRN